MLDWDSQRVNFVPMTECWKPVVGYEGSYEVSDQGEVRSVDRLISRNTNKGPIQVRQRGKILSPQIRLADGRWYVHLYLEGRREAWPIHTLILTAFVGPRPEGKHGCHNNDIKSDNCLSNLRWDTPSSNMIDMVRHGLHSNAKKTHCKRNHEFTPENTRITTKGSRQCLECVRITRQAREG